MKSKLIFIIGMLLFACGSNTTDYTYGTEKIIDIVDKHKYFLEQRLKGHKTKDVEIYKIDPAKITNMKYAYATVTYRFENNEDQPVFIYAVEDMFDKAVYKWINDSTLKVKMYNSSNNLSSSFCQRFGKRSHAQSIEPYN